MSSKINLQQLAKALAAKKGLTQKDAEAFLREFFDAIIQNVTTDKAVKIKGLGTFKLIEVLERESVNVNTGERIVIRGHSKLSFTPDSSLKEMVNKPFADFQTVIINEGTSLEEMEKVPALSPDFSPEEERSEAAEVLFSGDEAPEGIVEPEVPEEPESVVEPEEPRPETLTQQSQPEPVFEGANEEDDSDPFAPVKVRAMTTAEKCALTFGVILLCVASYFVGYYRLLSPPKHHKVYEEQETEIEAEQKVEAEEEQDDTISAVPVAVEDSVQKTLDPTGKYKITGTRKTHVMKPGDYLAKIALQEYGDKDFARYIIAHNRFPNPDNIPVGKEILLPELEKTE